MRDRTETRTRPISRRHTTDRNRVPRRYPDRQNIAVVRKNDAKIINKFFDPITRDVYCRHTAFGRGPYAAHITLITIIVRPRTLRKVFSRKLFSARASPLDGEGFPAAPLPPFAPPKPYASSHAKFHNTVIYLFISESSLTILIQSLYYTRPPYGIRLIEFLTGTPTAPPRCRTALLRPLRPERVI